MATIALDGNVKNVDDGDPIMNAAMELGLPFGCCDGRCGTCKVKVVSGIENLEVKNEREEEMDLEYNERLCCQAKIRGGSIEVVSSLE